MGDTSTTGETPGKVTCSADEAERLVRGMGLIFNNTFLYGPDHGVTRSAVTDCYTLLSDVMTRCEEVTFTSSAEEGLLVDGRPVELKNPLMRKFVSQMALLEISTFSLTRGMDGQKFNDLMEIMNARPEELRQLGGFMAVVAGSRIENVRVRKVILRQVEDHEQVINREEAEKVTAAAAKVANVAEIVSFLGGASASGGGQDSAAAALQSVASDSQKLAELIMQAADLHRETAEVTDAKSFSKLVIDCLKRAYEGLLKDPSVKTQKGKKNLARTLLTLEEQMLRKMRDLPGGMSDADTAAISEAIAEMEDELKIDSLTDEFVKKKSAVRSSEERILKYLRRRGLENIDEAELRGKLKESGLSNDEWDDLLLRSGLRNGAAGRGSSDDVLGVGASVGHLAALLVKMEEKCAKSRSAGATVSQAELNSSLSEVDQQVSKIVAKTERKIRQIVEAVRADRDAGVNELRKDGLPPAMTRTQLMELLAEAIQELCQPISVINCSLDMMRSNVLGSITQQQKDLLEVAASNGERIVTLVNRLMEVSGVPKGLKPDPAIQSSLY